LETFVETLLDSNLVKQKTKIANSPAMSDAFIGSN